MEWFELERILKIILSHPPAMGRDDFHQTTLLQAPFNLTWDTSRDEAVTATLEWSAGGGCTTTTPCARASLLESCHSELYRQHFHGKDCKGRF